MDKSNKRIVANVQRVCMELDAAFVKEKNWMTKLEWISVTNRFRALASCLAKLQVLTLLPLLPCLYCISVIFEKLLLNVYCRRQGKVKQNDNNK